ncbi:hypothetical protein SAY86_012644 [Trapa natans]|uniref:Uncharacterized protein n=1 Tax=Trapa natans TaxID=22666 RepID=A0AAN7MDB5_TRANT|nr:hypothetical protein SAY86_012644 [Trapa natans]
MNVVWGETAGVAGQLWLLCPILFILQGFEAYLGLSLLNTAFIGMISEWQVVSCGMLLVIMAVGNFLKHCQDSQDKVKVQGKDEKSKEQRGTWIRYGHGGLMRKEGRKRGNCCICLLFASAVFNTFHSFLPCQGLSYSATHSLTRIITSCYINNKALSFSRLSTRG